MPLERWTNPSLPQTLQIATFLFYIDAVFGVLFGIGSALGALLLVAGVAAGLGIANETKWGYRLALAVTSIRMAFLVWILVDDPGRILGLEFMFAALFPVAMFALVVHPMSREHQRIWFR